MKTATLTFLATLCSLTSAFSAEPDVLVVASTRPYSSQQGVKTMDELSIISLVRTRLSNDMNIRGKINIVLEDIYRTKKLDTAFGGGGSKWDTTYKCHSLAQWYFWPEGREERLANLRGEGDKQWDAVVLIGDASLIANMPGVFADGAKLAIDKVREGSANPILIIPPTSGPNSQAIAEAVCRVGMTADVPVLPRPTAGTLKKISTTVFDTENVFSMKHVDKRTITYNHTGSSSERGIEGGIKAAAQRCGVTAAKKNPDEVEGNIDFNYGRGNSTFEKNKQYKVEPDNFDRSYGFPMQDHSKSAAETMLYGIDRRTDDGTDLGIAWDMIDQNEVEDDVRCIPIRLMYAKLHDANPELLPCRDKWHMSRYLDTASGTFIYTLLSGRCPVDDKPSPDNKDAWNHWLGQKIGYETAWRMSHLGADVPGFVVRPNGTSQLKVKFLYPPKADVTVSLGLDQPQAGTVEPRALIFTPDNYNDPQTVIVKAASGDVPAEFKVRLLSSSSDVTFDKLQDSWPFTAKP